VEEDVMTQTQELRIEDLHGVHYPVLVRVALAAFLLNALLVVWFYLSPNLLNPTAAAQPAQTSAVELQDKQSPFEPVAAEKTHRAKLPRKVAPYFEEAIRFEPASPVRLSY
jgi:hypothetical protein